MVVFSGRPTFVGSSQTIIVGSFCILDNSLYAYVTTYVMSKTMKQKICKQSSDAAISVRKWMNAEKIMDVERNKQERFNFALKHHVIEPLVKQFYMSRSQCRLARYKSEPG